MLLAQRPLFMNIQLLLSNAQILHVCTMHVILYMNWHRYSSDWQACTHWKK